MRPILISRQIWVNIIFLNSDQHLNYLPIFGVYIPIWPTNVEFVLDPSPFVIFLSRHFLNIQLQPQNEPQMRKNCYFEYSKSWILFPFGPARNALFNPPTNSHPLSPTSWFFMAAFLLLNCSCFNFCCSMFLSFIFVLSWCFWLYLITLYYVWLYII